MGKNLTFWLHHVHVRRMTTGTPWRVTRMCVCVCPIGLFIIDDDIITIIYFEVNPFTRSQSTLELSQITIIGKATSA